MVRRRTTVTGLVGAWLQLSPLLGFAGSVIALNRALASLEESSEGGILDPTRVARATQAAVTWLMLGWWGGVAGCVLLGVAVFRQRCQVKWIIVLFWISFAHTCFGIVRGAVAMLNETGGPP